jgi:hypothetical protein
MKNNYRVKAPVSQPSPPKASGIQQCAAVVARQRITYHMYWEAKGIQQHLHDQGKIM